VVPLPGPPPAQPLPGGGGNLILASHSNDLLAQFCTRGLVLKHGHLVFDGPLEQAVEAYTQGVG